MQGRRRRRHGLDARCALLAEAVLVALAGYGAWALAGVIVELLWR